MDFKICKDEFDKYVSNFDMNISKVSRKYYHTYRVVDIIEKIAESEKLNEHDVYLAKVCALLHDIARFRQAVEYNTFNDIISFDHGNVGYEILKENDYINNFLTEDDDKQICLKAVKNHNKFQIEKDLTRKEMLFAQLLRDSDKIDILSTQKGIVEDNESEIYLPVLEALRNRKLYKLDFKEKLPNDISKIVIKTCFIFDLNYKKSFEILRERNIIKDRIEMIRKHAKTEIADEIEYIINSYMDKRV